MLKKVEKNENKEKIRELELTDSRTRGLVGFMGLAFLVKGHHHGRQNHYLIPWHEHRPREGLERTTLELKRHRTTSVDQHIEPDRST